MQEPFPNFPTEPPQKPAGEPLPHRKKHRHRLQNSRFHQCKIHYRLYRTTPFRQCKIHYRLYRACRRIIRFRQCRIHYRRYRAPRRTTPFHQCKIHYRRHRTCRRIIRSRLCKPNPQLVPEPAAHHGKLADSAAGTACTAAKTASDTGTERPPHSVLAENRSGSAGSPAAVLYRQRCGFLPPRRCCTGCCHSFRTLTGDETAGSKVIIQQQDKPELDKNAENTDADGAYTVEGVASVVCPSIVEIETYGDAKGEQLSGTGSGIISSEDGYIITNAHV